MVREPVTRVRLDAYRFGQRRAEAALARQDPTLAHEEIRGQQRVVVTGLALATLALVAAFGYARLASRPAWDRQDIVVTRESGRMFVVVARPEPKLVPVRNLAAARLVLAAVRGPGRASGTAAPVVVEERALDRAPRTAAAAVAGADGVRLPDGGDLASVGPWAVCDVAGPDPRTVVVAGSTAQRPLPDDTALLLRAPDNNVYLVLGQRRHRLDSFEAARRAYDLLDAPIRAVSPALLAAIPEGRPVRVPAVPDAGAAAPDGLPALVGDVVRVAGETGERYYLVLAGGVAQVPVAVAALLHAATAPDQPPPTIPARLVDAVPRVSLPGLDQLPAAVPRAVAAPDDRAVCWRWGPEGSGGAISVGVEAPIPADQSTTRLAQDDGPGPRVDAVSVPARTPVVVRAGSGGLWLVSDTGVGYQVAAGQNGGNETATALGIRPEAASAAPETALRLLPAGPPLDLQSATRTVDVTLNPGPAGS